MDRGKRIVFMLLVAAVAVPGIAMAQIVNIEALRRSPDDTARFKANVQSSFYYKNAAQVLFSFNAKSFVYYRFNDQMLLLSGDWGLTRAAGADFENQSFVHLRYNKKINKWLVGEAFTQIQQNKILNVKYRSLYGVGPRFELMKEKSANLFLGTLYMYEYELPTADDGQPWVKNRMSSYLSFLCKLTPTVTFAGITYYQPNLGYWSDYRLTGQYKLLVAITKKFSLKAETNILYDSTPVVGAVKSSDDFTFGGQLDF
jgi:Protein of unknown function, DUF481